MPKSPFWRQTLSRQQTYYRLDLRLLSSRTVKILFSINDMDSGVLSKQHKRGSGTACSLTGRRALGISAKQSYPWNPTPPSAQVPVVHMSFVYICEPHNPGAHNPTEPWETCQQMDANLGQLLPWAGLETCRLSFRLGPKALGPSETSMDSRNQ